MVSQRNSFKGFAKIDKLIVQNAKHHKLEQVLYQNKIQKHWAGIAGAFIEDAPSTTLPIRLKKGILTIACLSREVASMIKILAQRIIAALNQMLGRQVVFALAVEV